MFPEMKTACNNALKEHSTKPESTPAFPSDHGSSPTTKSLSPRDSAVTSTQAASGDCADTDLESILDMIRKRVPGANQKTNKELTECLLGMCTPASTVVDLATNAPKTSQAAKTAQESILQKYQLPTSEVLAFDNTSLMEKQFGHSQAALDTLPGLVGIEKFVAGKYNRIDPEDREEIQAKIEAALLSCQKSVQRIGATNNFFLLAKHFSILHNYHNTISGQYLEELNLVKEEKEEYQKLSAVLDKHELDLSQQAISTLHPGKLAPGLFSKTRDDSRYFWQGGEHVYSKLLAFKQTCSDIVS